MDARQFDEDEVHTVEILPLLEELELEITNARRSMIGGGVSVDRKRLLDLVEQLRLAIPANIRQARGIVEHTDRLVAEAEQRAQRVLHDADREAEARVSQAAVVRAAEERAYQVRMEAEAQAQRILDAARADAERQLVEAADRARQQEADADAYALRLLQMLEERAAAVLQSVHQARGQFGAQG